MNELDVLAFPTWAIVVIAVISVGLICIILVAIGVVIWKLNAKKSLNRLVQYNVKDTSIQRILKYIVHVKPFIQYWIFF